MPRLRNSLSGVVVVVDDATAATLGGEWSPVPEAVTAPAKRSGRPAAKK